MEDKQKKGNRGYIAGSHRADQPPIASSVYFEQIIYIPGILYICIYIMYI